SPIPPADLIVLPGSKSTIADLAFVRAQGWDIDIRAHHRHGGHVLGLCGGYQMLGATIADPEGFEGWRGTVEALGLLAVDTVLTDDKAVRPVGALHTASGSRVDAYEIHLGRTHGADTRHAPFQVGGEREGAASADGRVIGTYLHGLFAADAFRAAFLNDLKPGVAFRSPSYEAMVDETLDTLAAHLARHLDVDGILAIARDGP
ncbi:MAG: cobyric acid synthase CobQ, partial [Microvirga sp.]